MEELIRQVEEFLRRQGLPEPPGKGWADRVKIARDQFREGVKKVLKGPPL